MSTPSPEPPPPPRFRRGLPLLLAGLGLFAYVALSPQIPHERHLTYRFPRAAQPGALAVQWSAVGSTDIVGEVRFAVQTGQTQSAHDLVLPDGDYDVEAELPGRAGSTRRHVHVDADTYTIVFE